MAALGESFFFLPNFAKQVELFNSGGGSSAVVFAIGRALQGHVNELARTMFYRKAHNFDSLIGPAKRTITFYEAQIKATKDAMHAWTQVGIRWTVVKDMRKLIAKLLWDSREKKRCSRHEFAVHNQLDHVEIARAQTHATLQLVVLSLSVQLRKQCSKEILLEFPKTCPAHFYK